MQMPPSKHRRRRRVPVPFRSLRAPTWVPTWAILAAVAVVLIIGLVYAVS
jgi:hypothetical protein